MVRMWLVPLEKVINNYINWFFCDSDISSYKTHILKFSIYVKLLNKKRDIYSEMSENNEKEKKLEKWMKTWDKIKATLKE